MDRVPEEVDALRQALAAANARVEVLESALRKRLQEERKALADAELAAQEERLRALRLARDIGGS
jgi:predicted kinase